jgi:hypothetical protein
MAGIVTGELDGRPIMLENAATEATLAALLEVTLANSSNKSQAAKIQKAYEDALKRTTKDQEKNLDVMKKQKKAIEDENSERESLNKTIKEEKAKREKLFQNLQDVGQLLGKSFDTIFSTATPKVSDFTNALSGIPIIGPIIGSLGNAMQGQIDKFRELSQVGADFGGGIDQVRSEAARAGMSLETFSTAITANSKDLALLGGNATAGAKVFAEVNKSLQGPFQKSLARLGFSMEETADYTVGYLAQQTRLGLAQRMTQQQLNKGSQDYLLELDKLARVHGMSRKEAQAALDAQVQDKRFKLFYAQMGAMGNETKSFMAGLQSADKDFADGMADLIMNNGVPSATNEMAKEIARTQPELSALAQRLREGTISQEDANKIIRKSATAASQLQQSQGVNNAMFLNLTGTIGLADASMVSLQNHGLKAAQASDAQADAMKNTAKNQADLDKQLLDTRNSLMNQLTPTFQFLTNVITTNIEGIKKFVTALADGMNKFTAMVGEKGWGAAIGHVLGEAIKSALSALFNSPAAIGGLVGAVGLLFGAAAVKKALVDGLANTLSQKGGPPNAPGGSKLGGLAKGAVIMTALGHTIGAGASALGAGTDANGNPLQIDNKQDDENWSKASFGEKAQSAVPRTIEFIGGLVGLSSLVAEAKNKRIASETAYLTQQGRIAPSGADKTPKPSGTVTPEMAQAAEVAKIKTAEEVNAIAMALQTLDYGRLTVPAATIKSIDDGTNKLRFLRGEVSAMTTSFKALNETGLDKITAGIGRLDESFKNFNKSFAQDFMEKFKELDKKTQEALLTDLNRKMDQLNTSTNALVELAAENTRTGNKIARNTRDASGKVF